MIAENAVADSRENRSLALDIAWVVLFSSVFALVKAVERFGNLHIPGHSAALWMPVLFLGGFVVRRQGAVIATAATGGLLSMVPHLPHPLWLMGYVVAAAVLEMGLTRSRRDGVVTWMALGAAANLAKYAVKCAATWAGLATGFLSFGLLPGAVSHLLFGALGGLLAALVARSLTQRSRRA